MIPSCQIVCGTVLPYVDLLPFFSEPINENMDLPVKERSKRKTVLLALFI